jgi:hypothetical protein
MLLDPAHFCFRPSDKQFLSLHHFVSIQFTVPSELKSSLRCFTPSTTILKVKVGKIESPSGPDGLLFRERLIDASSGHRNGSSDTTRTVMQRQVNGHVAQDRPSGLSQQSHWRNQSSRQIPFFFNKGPFLPKDIKNLLDIFVHLYFSGAPRCGIPEKGS